MPARQLQLPDDLCQTIEQRYGKRFGSLEQFLTYILQELIRDEAGQMDRREQEIIAERLKDLGYV